MSDQDKDAGKPTVVTEKATEIQMPPLDEVPGADDTVPVKAPENTEAAFTEAVGADAVKTFNADIVDYSQASDTQKQEMDVLIDGLVKAIDHGDLTQITAFDAEPSERLGRTSEQILREVQNANSFLGSFRSFGEKIKDFDFDSVGETAREYTDQIQRKMKLAAIKSPIWRGIKSFFSWATGLGSKKSTAEDLRHEIDASLLQFGEVIADLEEAKDKIPGLAQKLNTQENARLEAYSDYGLYIGAAAEVYRRMKDETIPALDTKAAESGSVLDARKARSQKVAMTVLNKKITGMDTFHKSCLVQLETIDDLKEALVMSELNIGTHLTTSKNEWMAFLSEATSAVTMSEIAEATQKADQFGDEIFEQANTLSEVTKAMSRASFEHGAVDADKVAEFLRKKAVNVLEDLAYVEEKNDRFEAKRETLDKAAKELVAAKTLAQSPAKAEAGLEQLKLIEADTTNALPLQPTAKVAPEPAVAKPTKP